MTLSYRVSKDRIEVSVDGVTLSGPWNAMTDFVAMLYRSEQRIADFDFSGCDKHQTATVEAPTPAGMKVSLPVVELERQVAEVGGQIYASEGAVVVRSSPQRMTVECAMRIADLLDLAVERQNNVEDGPWSASWLDDGFLDVFCDGVHFLTVRAAPCQVATMLRNAVEEIKGGDERCPSPCA